MKGVDTYMYTSITREIQDDERHNLSISHSSLAVQTYPNSAIPSTNSFLVNSHCVAALNFHANINTVRLVGSRLASSQNRLTPSANILSSSTESAAFIFTQESYKRK